MNAERKKELRELCENATPGEWYRNEGGDIVTPGGEYAHIVCEMAGSTNDYDVELVLTARDTIAELLDEIERLNWNYDECMLQYNQQQERACKAEAEVERLLEELKRMNE